jgi:beta-lactamase class A
MLDIMSQDHTESMIEAGLPPGTKFARKHGWIGDTHADAAIVFSPGGDFILVVYLYRPQWLEWGRLQSPGPAHRDGDVQLL